MTEHPKKAAEAEKPEDAHPEEKAAEADETAEHDFTSELPDFLGEEQVDTTPPSPPLKELLTSPDLPSRFMTILSLAFAFLAITSFGFLVMAYVHYRHQKALEHPAIAAPAPKTGITPTFSESLGEFELILKSESKKNDGQLKVSVVVECSTPEACGLVKAHLDEFRDRVNPILSNSSRNDLINVETKTTIRHRIADHLNTLPLFDHPEQGKIVQVFFNDMMIEEDK